MQGLGVNSNLSGRTVLEQKPSIEGFHVPCQRPAQTLRHVCHANGLSHRLSPTRSQFIPVYTADDDELAGALERVNQEVDPGLIPLPILLESHSPSILGSDNRQNIASMQQYPGVR